MEKEQIYYILLLIINTIIYGFCCIMILKRKNYTCVSVRTPTLLLSNNLAGFFQTTILLLNQFLNKSITDILNLFYYIFQSMMIISFIMRSQRIVACCGIKSDERQDIQIFYDKRYLYQEVYYVKLMLKYLLYFSIIYFSYYFFFKKLITFISLINEDENRKLNQFIWLFIIFFELLILMTYAFAMMIDRVKQKVKFELYGFLFIWFIYWNFINWIYLTDKIKNEQKQIISLFISLIALYICLFLNGFFPVILSFCYRTSIAYKFNPKLMNDLYLFLTDEECYNLFSDFLNEHFPEELIYLKIYTHILNYKLLFHLKEPRDNINDEFNDIYHKYFENDNFIRKLSNEVVSNIRLKYESDNIPKNETFDDALQMCFIFLGKRFIDFKKTNEFQDLYDSLNLLSYIQCKMSNTGLIKNF